MKENYKRGGAIAAGFGVLTMGITATLDRRPSLASKSPAPLYADPRSESASSLVPPTTESLLSHEVLDDGSFFYRVEGEEWFGGFIIDIPAGENQRLGFSDPVQGPQAGFEQLLTMVASQQGELYGVPTINALKQYVKDNKSRFPQFNTSFTADPVELNFSKPFSFSVKKGESPQDTQPGVMRASYGRQPEGSSASVIVEMKNGETLLAQIKIIVDGDSSSSQRMEERLHALFSLNLFATMEELASIRVPSLPEDTEKTWKEEFVPALQPEKEKYAPVLNPNVFFGKDPKTGEIYALFAKISTRSRPGS